MHRANAELSWEEYGAKRFGILISEEAEVATHKRTDTSPIGHAPKTA